MIIIVKSFKNIQFKGGECCYENVKKEITGDMHNLIDTISSLEQWFNRKFGWFFTNGN